MKVDYEALLMEETEGKIREMEDSSYEFPDRFTNKDYIFTVVVILLCLVGVIGGAFIV